MYLVSVPEYLPPPHKKPLPGCFEIFSLLIGHFWNSIVFPSADLLKFFLFKKRSGINTENDHIVIGKCKYFAACENHLLIRKGYERRLGGGAVEQRVYLRLISKKLKSV